jgi:UDPglucose 6-dehydrogenase
MRIVVFGTGYVGLVTGSCLAEVGHDVICVDDDHERIKTLEEGRSPVFEPGMEELIRRNVEHERLRFSYDLGASLVGAAAVMIALERHGEKEVGKDAEAVEKLARRIGREIGGDLMIIVKTTLPVGTCDDIERFVREELSSRGCSHRVMVAANPDFLKEGDAINDVMRPDRIVVGVNESVGEVMFWEIYGPFVRDDPGRLLLMDRRSAELTKYASNAMLATRISFMNELARLCERVGASIDLVRRGMGADQRIGMKFLQAGAGYGGADFSRDAEELLSSARGSNVKLSILQAVRDTNLEQKAFAAQKIRDHFGSLKGKKIAVWGVAFKPGTADVRETPAKTIIASLLEWGAQVVAHDPRAAHSFLREFGQRDGLRFVTRAYDALEGADAMALITEWNEYKRPNWEKAARLMRGQVVFDFRNQYSDASLEDYGFQHIAIGRPDHGSAG